MASALRLLLLAAAAAAADGTEESETDPKEHSSELELREKGFKWLPAGPRLIGGLLLLFDALWQQVAGPLGHSGRLTDRSALEGALEPDKGPRRGD